MEGVIIGTACSELRRPHNGRPLIDYESADTNSAVRAFNAPARLPTRVCTGTGALRMILMAFIAPSSVQQMSCRRSAHIAMTERSDSYDNCLRAPYEYVYRQLFTYNLGQQGEASSFDCPSAQHRIFMVFM